MNSAAAAKSLQSCPTLCDPIDSSPLGSSVSGILQARTLEWVAISFSNAWKWKVKVKLLSRARLLATPWTAANQAPPSMGFSRQEYWSGLPLPSLTMNSREQSKKNWVPISHHHHLFSPRCPYICFLFLLCKYVHLYHFSRFHIYVLISDICFFLWDWHIYTTKYKIDN